VRRSEIGEVKVDCHGSANVRQLYKLAFSWQNKIVSHLGRYRKTRDSYLDTKKRRTSKTVKTKSFGGQNGPNSRSTITPPLAKIIG
jgi:hypothetical protein